MVRMCLSPDEQARIPTTRAKRHTVGADTQTRDSVLVGGKNTHPLALEGIPDVARIIIVPCEQDTTRNGESDRGDTAENVVVGVCVEFPVGSQIEQAARSVVRTRCESVTIGEELDRIDIALVASKRLYSLAGSNIPNLGNGVTGTRDKDVGVGTERDAHHVTRVVVELGDAGTRVNVPQDTAHVA